MNFITMLCLALANCEQFMSLSKAGDHGVSARSDLAEIDDLNLTAPSPLQRLLSSADDDEEEDDTDEADEDEENEEADESEVEDGKKGWVTPVNGLLGGLVGGVVLGGAGVGIYDRYRAEGPKVTVVEPKETLTVTGEEFCESFKTNFANKYELKSEDAAAHTLEVAMTLQQLKELPQWKTFTDELATAGITPPTKPAAEPVTTEDTGDDAPEITGEDP